MRAHIRRPRTLRRRVQPRLNRAIAEALEIRQLLAGLTIAQENQLPGTPASAWDISGIGDPSIQGFATDISVNQGQSVSFKIDDANLAAYHLDIYRMGYYQGLGARKVATISSAQTLAVAQPAPLTDSTTGLVDCGNWSVTASWSVPADATSGIYFAKVVREDTGGASHIVFVVRNDTGHSDLLFQTSDSTWQAYNTYGGNSLYTGNSTVAPGRAVKVSYNRPFIDRGAATTSRSWVFATEYPMVRWLESNGYDVSYSTDVDSDRLGSEILEHKVFMSVGHDEYWSAGQRNSVQAARDAGIDLAFFSGNEVNWKTRWETSIDGSGTAYRTLVCYKESQANAKIDPSPTWTGYWRDGRFSPPSDGGRPENALSGTIYTVDSGANVVGTPITVPASFSSFRFWRNTSVAGLSAGQLATLGDSILGYEWDEDLDNGSRPAGLIDLSSTTQNVTAKLQNLSGATAPGTATHSLTLYRAPSGSLVFSAGTIQWSWGLDASHDGRATAPDVNLKQATVNLLADMRVQPATLQPGLVAASASTDAAAPVAAIAAPAAGATVHTGATVLITGTATDSGGGVVAGVEVSTDGGATWHHATGGGTWSYSWTPLQIGTTTLLTRAVDDSGNLGAASAPRSIYVAGEISLWGGTALPANPAVNDSNAVELGVKFRSDIDGFITGLRFYKAASNTGTHLGHLWALDGTLLGSLTFATETASGWQTASFAQPIPVTANTTYVASYYAPAGNYAITNGYFATSGADNLSLHAPSSSASGGNGLYRYGTSGGFPTNTFNAANYWVDVAFDASPIDNIAPTVASVSPASGAVNVATNSQVNIAFSEAMDPATLTSGTIEIDAPGGAAVSAVVTYDSASHVATLTPTSALANNTQYTVIVRGGAADPRVKDAAGNALESNFTWSFTTAAPIGAGPYSMWSDSTVPLVTSTSDGSAVELGMKFRSDIAGFITGIRFYKGSGNSGAHVGHLWTSGGSLLASVNFGTETASGWQTATLSQPVAISANTTYVVSYYAPAGHYASNNGFFTSQADAAPLHALSSGSSGGNGVYLYAAGGGFPVNSFNATNYWVDVVLSTSANDTTAPTIAAVSPSAGATGVSPGAAISVTFSEPVQSGTISLVLRDASNAIVPATLSYNATTFTATLTPNAPLTGGAAYTATVGGAKDLAGNAMSSPLSWSFTTVSIGTGPFSFWSNTVVPAVPADSDPSAIEVGLKFRSDIDGLVTAIEFYKGSGNTGTHVGHLWTSAGALLATVNFGSETSGGWQSATLGQPVAITANTVYVVSYYAPAGHYADSNGYFSAQFDSGPLHAPSSGSSGGNGVYRYGTGGGFPTSTFNATNYWVDVVVSPVTNDTTPPTVTDRSPAAGATGVLPTAPNISATFSESVQAATISLVLRDSGGNAVPGTVAYNDSSHTVTLSLAGNLSAQTTYTITLSGAKDLAGNAMATTAWSFTTGVLSSLWQQSSSNDFSAGTQNGTVVTNTSGGEVQLQQAIFDDYLGTTLGGSWTTASWASAGGGPTSITVSGGSLTIAGGELLSSATVGLTPVEGRVSFGAAAYQHFGLATDFATAAGNSWAVFSTGGTTNTLLARVNVGGATQEVSLGAIPGGLHLYRVQPVSGGFQFWIDGVLQTTVNATMPGSTPLRIAASAFAGSPQPALVVDWIRGGAYTGSGSFVSSIFDAGRTANWGAVNWTASVPAGGNLIVEISSSVDGINWSSWFAVTNGGNVGAPAGRYLRYRVTFASADPSQSPVFQDIKILWT